MINDIVVSSLPGRGYPLVRVLAPMLVFWIVLVFPCSAEAKEFDIEGTIDCGQLSGKFCIPNGLHIGVLTDSISGHREHVDVDLTWVVQARLKRTGHEDLLTLDPQVSRAMAFDRLQEVNDRILSLGLEPGRMTVEDMARLTDTLLDRGLPREVAANRDAVFLLIRSLRQDAPVTLTVRNDMGAMLLAVSVRDRFDFITDTSEGTLNTGQLTGSSSGKDFCFDFTQESLDWARDKIRKDGEFRLNDFEEKFFDMLRDLPNPCEGYEKSLNVFLDNYARNMQKSVVDDISGNLAIFVQKNPDVKGKLLTVLLDSSLKQSPDSSNKFRALVRALARRG